MQLTNLSNNNELTLSSRVIAEELGKLHKNVLRDIEIIGSNLSQASKSVTYVGYNNRVQREWLLAKRDYLLVISGYRANTRAKLIDRWMELEEAARKPALPQTLAEALRLAADQAEQLALAAPKVKVYDKIAESTNLQTATQVGQKLGMSAKTLNVKLEELNVYNKAVKRGRTFKQWFLDAGMGEVKICEQGFSQALFTNVGELWIAENVK